MLPHLDYCSVVWQECTKDLRMKIERVQNYAYHTLTATQNAKQEVKTQAEIDDSGEKRNALVSTSPEMCDGGSTLLE